MYERRRNELPRQLVDVHAGLPVRRQGGNLHQRLDADSVFPSAPDGRALLRRQGRQDEPLRRADVRVHRRVREVAYRRQDHRAAPMLRVSRADATAHGLLPELRAKGGERMNREQAKHILDAYTDMQRECGDEDACVGSLREVILDAMTSYRVTTPNITWPSTYPLTVPNVTPNKPIVTC